jgi:REP element-mobilizing transposase RayT
MSGDPLGYFLTWTTYGTWLPGDERGWVDGTTHEMHFTPSRRNEERARNAMTEPAVALTPKQRDVVEGTIKDHCRIRGWELRAVNVRTNHVHVVVSLPDDPDKALREFKAWGTRRLKIGDPERRSWWTEGGSKRWLWTEEDLEQAVIYVRDFQ